ncbi:hypothetical protein [Achromobacter mucicolens]|uniref:hypothetical protein n=1 Tax=Achromobacter mucicolens TaxID=1389922 RepID=UPI002FE39536
MDTIPDEVSQDGSTYVTYTRDKEGRVIAAHCTQAAHQRKRITLKQKSQLQALEALFS